MIRIILLILLLAVNASALSPAMLGTVSDGGCSGWNCGITDDSDAFGWWDFENNGTDDKGSNDWTTGTGTVTYGTTTPTPMVGTYYANFDGSSANIITDANLDTNYPLKNGDAQKIMTICSWVDIDSNPALSTGQAIYSKYDSGADKRTFWFGIYNDAGTIKWRMSLGHTSGTAFDTYAHATTGPTANTWYYVCAGMDTSNVYIKLRDSSGNVIGSDYSTSILNTLNVEDTNVALGAIYGGSSTLTWFWIGEMDEMVVFDKVLTATEVTNLSKGNF